MLDTNIKGHFIENKNFKTVFVELWIPYVAEKDYIPSCFLPSLLVHTNLLYPKEEIFQRKLLEKNILEISCGKRSCGKNSFFIFTLTMPDQTLIDLSEIEEGIRFFFSTVYEPNIQNHRFDEIQFERVRSRLITSIHNAKKDIDEFAIQMVMDEVDEEGFLKESLFHHMEDVQYMSNDEVVNFYENKIQKVRPFVFTIGNIEKEKIEKVIEEQLYKRNVKPLQIKKEYTAFLPCHFNTYKEKKISRPYAQSVLIFAYKIKDMKEEDRLPLSILSSLLSSQSSDLLMKNLRDEKGLVYTAYSRVYDRFNLLLIEAKIYREAYEEAKTQIFKTMEILKNGDIKNLLQNIKDRRRVNLKRGLDNKFAIVSDSIAPTLGFGISMEQKYQDVLKMTEQDISNLAKRLKLELIYFVEGDKDVH